MVLAHADITAGVPYGSALTANNVAGDHGFAAERLDAKTAARGVAAVA
jgi:hypothetical protein